MQYTIEGELAQTARLKFSKGDDCWAGKSSLLSINPEISWSLKIPGGMSGSARRLFSGEGISLTYIESSLDDKEVILSANEPGKIMDWDLSEGAVITTRGSFVAVFGSQIDIDVMVAKRTGAAFFGGAGLFLQKVFGQGKVLIHGSGDFIERRLREGESILVSTGNLAAFSDEIDYNIEGIGSIRKLLFSGEGLFMTKLTGPGRVLLQSLKRVSARKKKHSS